MRGSCNLCVEEMGEGGGFGNVGRWSEEVVGEVVGCGGAGLLDLGKLSVQPGDIFHFVDVDFH